MSKGTTMRHIRMSEEDWLLFETVVQHRNDNVNAPPWSMSDFVRIACHEKIDKMKRSRGRSVLPPPSPVEDDEREKAIKAEYVDFAALAEDRAD